MNKMKKLTLTLIAALVLAGIYILMPLLAFADSGMVVMGPLPQGFAEHDQTAIVAWNGTEEALILSIGVQSSEDTTALRIVPLPSNPSKIEAADTECFETVLDLHDQKWRSLNYSQYGFLSLGRGGTPEEGGSSGVVVTFRDQIGAHDLTVVEVSNLGGFVNWIENFATDNGLGDAQLTDKFNSAIVRYLNRDINYFVFDVVEAGTDHNTVEPLLYRFETDRLFYPMELTAASIISEPLGLGKVPNVSLFLFTEGQIDSHKIENADLWPHSGYDTPLFFSVGDLNKVHTELADLFEQGSYLATASYRGSLEDLDEDLTIGTASIYPVSSTDRYYASYSSFMSFLHFDLLSGGEQAIVLSVYILLCVLFAWLMTWLIKMRMKRNLYPHVFGYAISAIVLTVCLFYMPAQVPLTAVLGFSGISIVFTYGVLIFLIIKYINYLTNFSAISDVTIDIAEKIEGLRDEDIPYGIPVSDEQLEASKKKRTDLKGTGPFK